MGAGIAAFRELPIDAFPDVSSTQVKIIVKAPGMTPEEVELRITAPIEVEMLGIPKQVGLRSVAKYAVTDITVDFADGTDIYWARQQVAERLQQVQTQIPAGIGTPELGPVSTGLGEIYQYVVRPEKGYEDQYDETELRTIQDWIVRRQLLGVKGVAEVSSFGGKLKQLEIAIDNLPLQK